MLLRGLQDAFKDLTGALPAKGQNSTGKARVAGKASVSNAQPPLGATFRESWQTFCTKNPRLRDPKALPALMRLDAPPEDLRAEVWLYCLGIDTTRVAGLSAATCSPSLDDDRSECQADSEPPSVVAAVPTTEDAELPDSIVDLIEADVLRTFSTSREFEGVGGPDSLRRVLRRMVVTDIELGYCQSMNFLAAIFIMVLRDESAALNAVRQVLVKLGTRSWYMDGMLQLRGDTAVLEDLIQCRLPVLHKAFKKHQFDLLIVSSKWFLCLFATALEGEALRRVWDVVLCDGIEAVFRISLALLAQHTQAASEAKSVDDLILLFQMAPPLVSAEDILKAAYDPKLVGNISRSELAQQRQQASRKVSSDDTRAEMRSHHLWRGGVRPASVLSRA
eukprot:TRINITY_DN6973_c0_g1_i2.p1 TRINITY_DN6973_c0_g1~~TRINITY_DN6973_c0_g1_i2.p1  ORF type:complete len:391 (-),score=69.97 TRINITY_DN6973_c0_g1_i2:101-1273(-)